MNHSENINELVTALSKVQGEIKPASKSSINPHFKSKYADLNEVWNACREALAKNNLALIQTMDQVNGQLSLITTLAHTSGQWIKSTFPLICSRPDNPQAYGSLITYIRRYTLSSIVGISSDEDDDGNSAKPIENKPVQKQYLSQDLVNELVRILDKCDPKFVSNLNNNLKSFPYPVRSFAELTFDDYQKIKSASSKNSERYQAHLNSEALNARTESNCAAV